jgi:hypothetical protein
MQGAAGKAETMNDASAMLRRAADGARRALLGTRKAQWGARERPDGEPLYFIFTIDTEISMGGAGHDPSLKPVGARKRIWGETQKGSFGITTFMDVFEEHGMRAVFFFEPVARRLVGEKELEDAARHIVARGHDVELHIHPEFDVDLERLQRGEVKTPPWSLVHHDHAAQRRYIKESLDCLERWTGRRPIAFRAGGYGAGDSTLVALREEGVFIDSSYNAWAVGAKLCGLDRIPPMNDAGRIGGDLIEVPVTNVYAKGVRAGLRPFELSALNATEMIAAIEELYDAGARVACGVTHSFRLLRARDVQYQDAALDSFNLHRLRALTRHLAEHPHRFRVLTFRDLPLDRWRRDLPPPDGHPYYPTPPLWSSTLRLALQAVKDRGVV